MRGRRSCCSGPRCSRRTEGRRRIRGACITITGLLERKSPASRSRGYPAHTHVDARHRPRYATETFRRSGVRCSTQVQLASRTRVIMPAEQSAPPARRVPSAGRRAGGPALQTRIVCGVGSGEVVVAAAGRHDQLRPITPREVREQEEHLQAVEAAGVGGRVRTPIIEWSGARRTCAW